MTDRLAGKTAVVTAAAQGMGRAAALAMAREGARVIATDVNAEKLTEIAGPSIETRRLDVLSAEAIEAFVAEVGAPDVLFNCAGVVHGGTILDCTEADWDFAFALNARSMFRMVKAVLPGMLARGGGSIINMSSLMGLRGYPMRSAYTATKFAVIGITEAVAQEVGIHGIRVNALCPGAVNGELMQRVIAARAAKEDRPAEEIIKVNYTDKAALKRWVEPEEVARAALFLASDQSSSVTSERIKVDAGRM